MIEKNRNVKGIANHIKGRMPQVKLRAFTLAEVLITLVIIGVVSVLVLPTVITKVQGYANKRAHMVFQSKIKTGIQLMTGSNALVGYQTTEQFVEQFKRYIKIAKVCDNEHLTECFTSKVVDTDKSEIEIKNGLKLRDLMGAHLNGSLNTNVNGLILQDGTNILLAYNTACATPENGGMSANLSCISMVYDTNGGSKPNMLSAGGQTFSVNLGTKEDNSNLNRIKDIGLVNADNFGHLIRFDGTAESCEALGGIEYNGKCEVYFVTYGSWYYAKEYCTARNITMPSISEMGALIGASVNSRVNNSPITLGVWNRFNQAISNPIFHESTPFTFCLLTSYENGETSCVGGVHASGTMATLYNNHESHCAPKTAFAAWTYGICLGEINE